jgi:hypothetical protein
MNCSFVLISFVEVNNLLLEHPLSHIFAGLHCSTRVLRTKLIETTCVCKHLEDSRLLPGLRLPERSGSVSFSDCWRWMRMRMRILNGLTAASDPNLFVLCEERTMTAFESLHSDVLLGKDLMWWWWLRPSLVNEWGMVTTSTSGNSTQRCNHNGFLGNAIAILRANKPLQRCGTK